MTTETEELEHSLLSLVVLVDNDIFPMNRFKGEHMPKPLEKKIAEERLTFFVEDELQINITSEAEQMLDRAKNGVFDVMMSTTMGQLAYIAEDLPLDVMDDEEFFSTLKTCIVDLAFALDSNRIKFNSLQDSALFHGLLAICLSRVLEGKVTADVVTCH